ncbi:MAG: tRNA-uridine aminocarboxypropyltransferase [Campylobacterota bacterium]|nr:tRNA-uridine aminocarboxypropyltransferase [Campylobacterota bacterium]
MSKTYYGDREKCYRCYRPQSSCMCSHIYEVKTNTKFIVLMHPKEFKKIKNGTGHLTHLSLPNSRLFIGIDFTKHKEINDILATHDSFVLYPSKDAINITNESPSSLASTKNMAVFIIDSTWACSSKMLQESKNLQQLDFISFSSTKLSQFKIKEQPAEYCLSTIESTLEVLELLNKWKIENLEKKDLDNFLNPFHQMIEYQIKCVEALSKDKVRFKHRDK